MRIDIKVNNRPVKNPLLNIVIGLLAFLVVGVSLIVMAFVLLPFIWFLMAAFSIAVVIAVSIPGYFFRRNRTGIPPTTDSDTNSNTSRYQITDSDKRP